MGFRRYIRSGENEVALTRREADRLISLSIIDLGTRDDEEHSVVFRLLPYMDMADAVREISRKPRKRKGLGVPWKGCKCKNATCVGIRSK